MCQMHCLLAWTNVRNPDNVQADVSNSVLDRFSLVAAAYHRRAAAVPFIICEQ